MRNARVQGALFMAMAASVATLMSFSRLAEPRIVAVLSASLGAEAAHWLALVMGVGLSVAVYTVVSRSLNRPA